MGHIVYVMECRGGKYYVGRCAEDRLQERLREHRAGTGSAWTAAFPAIRIVRAKASSDPLDEDHEVLSTMRIHGIADVRGGSYNTIHLTAAQQAVLLRQLDHAAGRCLRCGGMGHWVDECRSTPFGGGGRVTRVASCLRCGRTGHSSDACFARTDVHGGRMVLEEEADTDENACFRCGRVGHWADSCYARTDVAGRRLHA